MLRQGKWSLVLMVCLLGTLSMGCDSGSADKAPAKGGEFVPEGKKKTGGGEFVPGQKEKPAAKKTDAKFEGAGEHLLKPGEQGLKLEQGPDYYTKKTLFEIIDGASEGYIAYGMVQMAKAVYKAEEKDFKDEINVEVYQFSPKLGAFGKFAQERSSCADVVKYGEHWCVRQSDLIFWKGDKMVKVQTFDDSKAAEAAILRVGKEVEKRLSGTSEIPEPLARSFPKDKRVLGGGGYSPRDEFGFKGLGPVWMQEYSVGKGKAVLYMSKKKSPAEAQELFASMKATVEKLEKVKANGGLKKVEGAGEEAFVYDDGYGKHTIMRKGSVVGGGREFEEQAAAQALTKQLSADL